MDLGLQGRVAAVTGAGTGIGRGCAVAFVAEGARVALVPRRRANLDAAAWRAAVDAKCFSHIHPADVVVKRRAARGRAVIVNVIGQGGRGASPVRLPRGAANPAI